MRSEPLEVFAYIVGIALNIRVSFNSIE